MIFNCAKYLCGESDEVFIPVPSEISLTVAMSRVKSHAHRLRRKATCETIYACHRDGRGLRILCVKLDEPVKKLKKGRPLGSKNKPKPLELLQYIEEKSNV